MTIVIQNLQGRVACPEELNRLLNKVGETFFQKEALSPDVEVSLVLVDDEEISRYNKNYRNIDDATDVLSFPQLEPGTVPEPGEPLGDIMISMERAQEQATEYGHSLEREVAFLLVHGLYHLLGYDHLSPAEEEIMRAKEETILGQLGLER